ncbi:JM47 [macacine gammaherpesvirus 11]|uniref:JM47 n=2 Tax=macacine gammaherpesvirus 11 TaxID=2560570 RepID=G9JMM5_9GAMA|nr:JM47 [Macaca fuscata rhadinovirus]AAT00024.1 JM47 [Macaca fuscata rhadinovirus]AEW87572.1 JM47 [Macaca fuscata rhadinovirus]AEW87742.1 JM47 [Macaca fuscata rhadinovirus]
MIRVVSGFVNVNHVTDEVLHFSSDVNVRIPVIFRFVPLVSYEYHRVPRGLPKQVGKNVIVSKGRQKIGVLKTVNQLGRWPASHHLVASNFRERLLQNNELAKNFSVMGVHVLRNTTVAQVNADKSQHREAVNKRQFSGVVPVGFNG